MKNRKSNIKWLNKVKQNNNLETKPTSRSGYSNIPSWVFEPNAPIPQGFNREEAIDDFVELYPKCKFLKNTYKIEKKIRAEQNEPPQFDPIKKRAEQVAYQKFIKDLMDEATGEEFKIYNAEFDRIQEKIDGIDRINAKVEAMKLGIKINWLK